MQTEQGGLYRPAPFLCFICAQRLFASVLFYFSLSSKSTMRQFEYLLRHSSNPQLRKSESWQSEERMNSPPRSVMYSAMSKAGYGVTRQFLAIAPVFISNGTLSFSSSSAAACYASIYRGSFVENRQSFSLNLVTRSKCPMNDGFIFSPSFATFS